MSQIIKQQNSNNYSKVNLLTKKWSEACLIEFVVLDFETTGLKSKEDEIIEIAAIRYKNRVEVEKFFTLIKPISPISSRITKITGITNEMVANCPPIEPVLKNLCGFIGNSIIVAHNASFDMNFLRDKANEFGIHINNNVIDTLQACRKLFPGFQNHKLLTICDRLGITPQNYHRAREDARACAQILFKCIDEYNSNKSL